MSSPTRFVNGVSTQPIKYPLANFPLPDPTSVSQVFQDFNQYVAGDWTVTNTGSHATIGLIAGAGGLVDAAGGASSVTSDIGAILSNPLSFNLPVNASSSSYPPSTKAWFSGTMKATTAANDQLQIGVTSANSALTPTDGIYFNKAAGSAAVTFVVRKSSSSLAATAYSTGTSTVTTLVDATLVELAWYYDGKGYIKVYVNNAEVCSVDVGGSTGAVVATFPQAVALGGGFGIKAAATAPTTSDFIVDYLLVAQERSY
jgi:hypothetical protein